MAINLDSPEIIKNLLDKGVQIEGTDINGKTPLIRAIDDFKVAAAKVLLEKGANAQVLVTGAQNKDVPLFSYIISHSSKTQGIVDPYDFAKIYITVAQSKINPSLANFDINAPFLDGKTILGYIKSLPKTLARDNFITFLIEHGAKESN